MRYFRWVKIKVTGVNFGSLLQMIQSANIVVGVDRQSDTVLIIKTKQNNLAILFDILKKKCYTYEVYDTSKNKWWYICGAGCALILLLIVLFVLSRFFIGVTIVGDADEGLYDYLCQNAVGVSWQNLDTKVIESTILQQFDTISMVDVSKKGLYLVVNTTPATKKPENNFIANENGLFADRSGVVSRIFVASGTACVAVGDTVSFGQMLVAPYVENEEGEKTSVSVKADVYLYEWSSAMVEFSENQTEYARTGNVIFSQKVMFFDKILSKKEVNVPFGHFETETSKRFLSDTLPLVVLTTYYYETTLVPVKKDFKAEEQSLIYQARQMAIKDMLESEICEEKHTISTVGDKYYITYYVKKEYKVG